VWESDTQPNTAEWICDQLAHLGHWGLGGDRFGEEITRLSPDGDPSIRFGSAVLSRWPIDRCTHHRLPVLADADLLVRAIPFELVHARTAGLHVFACHLAAAPTDLLHRRAQVLEIDRIVRAAVADPAQASTMPPVLCGDFNAEPDSDEIRFLCGLTALDGRVCFFQDAWRVAGEVIGPPEGFTQDWRSHPLASALNVHRKRIDYVFVGDPFRRRGDAGRVLRAERVFDRPRTGVQASDHAGLCVDIVWPDRPRDFAQ
jgi:Metal-dependent hydrolase